VKNRLELVVVQWEDAYVTFDFEEHEPCIVHDVGWLIEDEASHVCVASELLPNNTPRGVTRVPRSLVRRIERIGRKRSKRIV